MLLDGRPDLGYRLIGSEEVEAGSIPDQDPAKGSQGF